MSDSVQRVASALTRKAVHDLVLAVRATPEEKLQWQPQPEARPILEQLVECCLANRIWAKILQTHIHAFLPDGEAARIYAEIDTATKAIGYLLETSEQLVAVLHDLPDANLGIVVPFPWNPQRGIPLAECCFHAYWNLTYHLGQISYIQTLYGDHEEHGDVGPFGDIQESEPASALE